MKKRICMLMVALILALPISQLVQLQKASASFLFPVDYALYWQALDKGESAPNHHSQEIEKRSLPTKRQKLSLKDLVRHGKVVQRRYYDEDGNDNIDYDLLMLANVTHSLIETNRLGKMENHLKDWHIIPPRRRSPFL
ncbi:hypothetical protein [Paenibacillus popilliae]|uniref:hypothetical protein n=1 Tax=Paenibacillus popilliae TaxID=78057 RepID=UPI0005A8B45A|nr:hypothetical protein [Paenibacillus popilliae]